MIFFFHFKSLEQKYTLFNVAHECLDCLKHLHKLFIKKNIVYYF